MSSRRGIGARRSWSGCWGGALSGELVGLEGGVRAVVLHQAHVAIGTTTAGEGGQDRSGTQTGLGSGDLHGILAGSVDIHFHPERTAVQGPVRCIGRPDIGGHPCCVLHEINGPGVAGPVIEELETIAVPRKHVVSEDNAPEVPAVHLLAHGDLHGPGPAGGLVIKKEVIGPIATAALGNTRATGAPTRKGLLIERVASDLPTKGNGIAVEIIGNRALGDRVATVLGDQSLLPQGRLGVLGTKIHAPFNALCTRIEIGTQLVIPITVSNLVIDTVMNARLAAPNGRAAIVSIARISDRARSPSLDLILITIEHGIVTTDPATEGAKPCAGRTATQPQAGPVHPGVRRSGPIDDLPVLFNVPNVVPVRDGDGIGAGLGGILIDHHQGLALAGIAIGGGIHSIGGLSPTTEPGRVDAISGVVPCL